MGSNKKSFEEMREEDQYFESRFQEETEEIQEREDEQSFQIPLFDATVTKKECKAKGEELIENAIESGNIGKHELMANLVRLQEVINSAVVKLRDELPYQEMQTMGVKFTTRDGGNSVNYEEDPLWLTLKSKISQREELLKMVSKTKSEIYDDEGILVPVVGTTPRRSSIAISF